MKKKRLKIYGYDKSKIVLKGKWLENIGFNKGEYIDLIYDNEYIMIIPTEKIKGAEQILNSIETIK